jgi:glycosyltransferase involved in cell wall biosynthesis
MKNPLITIVMPAKNTALFLTECLDSILIQTYINWELLVVDDNSTDTTISILENYAHKDNRIQVFKNKGVGIIDALRLAYSYSKGDFVTRMDADDVMAKNKLEVMLNQLQDNGIGFLATGLVNYFCEGEIGEGFKRYEEWLNNLSREGLNFDEIYKECVIPSPCWMLHKSDFDKAGAFNADIYPEDYDLAFRFKEINLKCIPTDNELHHWRDYSERTSRTDVNYADSSFIDIKVHYFLKSAHQKNKNLVVWGAGKKGKRVAELLVEKNIPFSWICDNPKKIGKEIYNKKMLPFQDLDKIENSQSIITVANSVAQEDIVNFFIKREKDPMKDYFFFC